MKNDRHLFVMAEDLIEGVDYREVRATWNDMAELGINNPPYPEFSVRLTSHSFAVLAFSALDRTAGALENAEKELREVDGKLVDAEGNVGELEEVLYDLQERGETVEDLKVRLGEMNEHRRVLLDPRLARSEITINYKQEEGGRIRVTTSMTSDVKFIGDSFSTDQKGYFSTAPSKYVYFALLVLLAARNVVRTTKESKAARLGIGKNRFAYTTTLSLGAVADAEDGDVKIGGKKRPHLRRGHIRNQHYGPNGAFLKRIFVQPVFVNAYDGAMSMRSHYNVRRSRDERSLAESG